MAAQFADLKGLVPAPWQCYPADQQSKLGICMYGKRNSHSPTASKSNRSQTTDISTYQSIPTNQIAPNQTRTCPFLESRVLIQVQMNLWWLRVPTKHVKEPLSMASLGGERTLKELLLILMVASYWVSPKPLVMLLLHIAIYLHYLERTP